MSPSFCLKKCFSQLSSIALISTSAAVAPYSAHSQPLWLTLEELTPLPLIPTRPNVDLITTGVNADGSIISGSINDGYNGSAILWPSAQTTPILLGKHQGSLYSFSYDISADGQVVVGNSRFYSQNSNQGHYRAFRWENGLFQDLGFLPGGTESFATASDASGEIIVGAAENSNGFTHAFLWQNGKMQDLGTVKGADDSVANSISADGTVVVGALFRQQGGTTAFRWQNGKMEALSPLKGDDDTDAHDVSADGHIIVGSSGPNNASVAVRWVDKKIQNLGTLNGDSNSYARATSASGNIIVGSSTHNGRSRAFRWQNGKMEDIGQLTGAINTFASDISADGRTIVGSSYDGLQTRAFIYRNTMQDLANVQASAVEVADEFANAVDLNGRLARELREEECHISSGYNACLGVRSGVTSLFQGTNAFGGSVTGAVQIDSELKLGASVGAYGEGNAGSTLDLNYGVSIGAFAEYLIDALPFSSSETQFRARLDGAWLYSDADVTRGQGYTDVQTGKGSTSFNSGTVGAKLIADHQISETLVVSPYIGAYWESTYQAGYNEQMELDTIAHIHGGSTSAVAGVFGVWSRFSASEQLELSFGLQGEVDFFADDVEVSASTNIPGLAHFSVGSDRSQSKVRITTEAGAAYNLTEKSRVEVIGKVFSSRYQDKLGGDLALRFSSSF
ncbi:probable extracellular repeat, HAF family [Pseudovibrio denitrificans]|uniref:Probable extracellular repeat, HAF family n=1 Tax=Pseudovibrio denitrificans TaxID=258256 RepID=A0A1I7CQY0_9HYPH|nr:hypothetical protein [Pseudovibrio denitrificans]SFU01847.1 probable extracellular repeat, HAF family [Pseudovibrio denitrificans]